MMIMKFLKKQSPARIISFSFVLVILIGSGLLMLPFSIKEGVHLSYVDSLYTSASAVCVTGLVTVDPGDTFTAFGQGILAALIQIGGLGVAAVGTGVIFAIGKRIDLGGRKIVKEAMNLDSGKGIVRFLKSVFITTFLIEGAGAILCFPVFVRQYSVPKAIGLSLFHSIASFNNSGFDVFGGGQSMIPYQDHVYINLVTCALVILGGIGFLVIHEVLKKRFHWKQFSMHTKIVLSVSAVLILGGTILLKLTENVSFLGAFFFSVSSRTAGFASVSPERSFTKAGILTILIVLMFIGASPGSTGGGIKTTTFFAAYWRALNPPPPIKSEKAFHYCSSCFRIQKSGRHYSDRLWGSCLPGTYLLADSGTGIWALWTHFLKWSVLSEPWDFPQESRGSLAARRAKLLSIIDHVYRPFGSSHHCLSSGISAEENGHRLSGRHSCHWIKTNERNLSNVYKRRRRMSRIYYGIVGLGRFGQCLGQ